MAQLLAHSSGSGSFIGMGGQSGSGSMASFGSGASLGSHGSSVVSQTEKCKNSKSNLKTI